MQHGDAFLHNSRRGRSQTQHVPPNPFRAPPAASSTLSLSPQTRTGSVTRNGKGGAAPRSILSTSSPLPHLAMAKVTLAGPSANLDSNAPTSASAAATYTGAAILSSYTNRRKMLQKASALSTQMHKRVEDVVEMEEEQRLLSQAYRSRQKLAEQEQAQQRKQDATAAAASRSSTSSEPTNSPGQDALHLAADGEDRPSGDGSGGGGAAAPPATSTSGGTDGYGVVLEGAPDTKRLLLQQTQEKSETLDKMRGMQLAIQELGAEAAVEEERWFARSRFTTEVAAPHATTAATAGVTGTSNGAEAKTNGDDDILKKERSSSGSSTTNNNNHTIAPLPKDVPLDVISKLDTIRDIRLALKDMLDARRPHPADSGSYGTSSSGNGGGGGGGSAGAGINTSGGTTWVEQDSVYTPPTPPQVFSTNALAVTLEYISDAMASMARVADEFCIATTFRARGDRLTLLPQLHSLEKWTAQAELSLETAQRHLRHFHVGETAVLEGGAYEVNSLREQTLLLKETLTAQDQKAKATREAQTAVLHRLREIRQRCRMWESHLLHRQPESDRGDRSLESPLLYAFGHTRENRSIASLSTRSNSSGPQPAGRSADGTVVPAVFASPTTATAAAAGNTRVFGQSDAPSTTAGSPSSTFHGQAEHGTEHPQCSTVVSHRDDSARTQLQRANGSSTMADSDASPPPRAPLPAPPAVLKDFLPTSSFASPANYSKVSTGAAQVRDATLPPSPSVMDQMERRIAQSWGNPYVRKRLLRQRAEAAAAAAVVAAEASQQEERDLLSFPSLPTQQQQQQQHHQQQQQQHAHFGGDCAGTGGELGTPQRLLTSPQTPQFGGPSPTTPTIAAFSGASGTGVVGSSLTTTGARLFARASPEERGRRSQVSIAPPRTPSPAFGDAGDYASHVASLPHRTSRAFGSVATVVSVASGMAEADLAELADGRTLQLLQSLLRSVPANASSARYTSNHATATGASAETPLGVADVMQDEAARESNRRSIQRLIHFLKAQTKQPNQNQLSTSQK